MAGLLDLFGGSPQAQGLLAATAQILQASGPSFRPTSFGQILGGGLQAGQEATQLARARDLQFRGAEADLAAQDRARAMQEQELAAARGAIRTPGQQAAALPGGPTAENAARIGEFPQQFDPDAYVAAMMQINPLRALEIKRSLAKAGPEFDTKPQVATDDMGNVFQYLVAKDGSIRKLDGVKPREKLSTVNLGGKTGFVDDYTGNLVSSLDNSVSPDAQLSSWTQQRGQNMTDQRAREANDVNRMGQRTQIVNDPVQGPMLVDKGTGQARSVMMNGRPVLGETVAKKEAAAKSLMPLITDAEKLIKGATGSYLGAAADHAARWYGHATPGAQNIAQLSVLEGNLMMAQPRMEGPQSNMDVALYKQMAAQIGDPTVPYATKKAALTTLKSLYKKYVPDTPAESSGGAGDIKFLGFE
ncbi:hypothetical protein [Massilia sp. NP310]|uniref:hypothetical protein n=1 Tax=Massilia sp. NP310 TaxID=2861282 RepID=UPI001C635FF7|nr:hypothetical protein [Massilia sp. NP310]QYG03896.1 hypothetical protein KY496_11200 [Massilia sp. NP310]